MDAIDSPGSQDTIVVSAEYSGAIQTGPLISLDALLPDLQYHKIFLFTETIRSVAVNDYFVKASVKVFRNNRIATSLPASIGQDQSNSLIPATLVSVFPCLFINATAQANVPCSPAQEGIVLTLSKAFGNALQALVGHHKFIGSIDRLQFNVEAFGSAGATITSFRAVLGVISTANAF